MNVVGIVSGFKGAIAVLDSNGQILELLDMPIFKTNKVEVNESKIANVLKKYTVDHVFIEKAIPNPDQDITNTFWNGMIFGILQGICFGMRLRYTIIVSPVWRKFMLNGTRRNNGSSIVRVKQLYSNIELNRKDIGKADAILIGLYGMKILRMMNNCEISNKIKIPSIRM